MNQKEKDLLAQVATLSQAITYLQEHHKPDFKAFNAIMCCHILEIAELSGLKRLYKSRNWYGLGTKMRAVISQLRDQIVTAASGNASREDLRTLADRIRLLRLLAAVAGGYSQTEEIIGN